jgi:hypothetical protein
MIFFYAVQRIPPVSFSAPSKNPVNFSCFISTRVKGLHPSVISPRAKGLHPSVISTKAKGRVEKSSLIHYHYNEL